MLRGWGQLAKQWRRQRSSRHFCINVRETYWRMGLYWGVVPKQMEEVDTIDDMLAKMEHTLVQDGSVKPGDTAIIIAGAPLFVKGTTNMLKIHRIGG